MTPSDNGCLTGTPRMDRAGFDVDTADALRRIEMTLSRWSERECNGEIERDGDNGDGKPFAMRHGAESIWPIASPTAKRAQSSGSVSSWPGSLSG